MGEEAQTALRHFDQEKCISSHSMTFESRAGACAQKTKGKSLVEWEERGEEKRKEERERRKGKEEL